MEIGQGQEMNGKLEEPNQVGVNMRVSGIGLSSGDVV